MPFGALAGLASGLFGYATQTNENEKNRQFNAEQAQLQRQFQLDVMHEQMAYNDPSAYMSRLKAAGINPNLAVGGLSGTAPSAGSGSSASFSGSITRPDLIDPLYFSQRRLLESQANKNDAEAARTSAETPWIDKLNQSLIELQRSGVDLNLSVSDLNDKSGFKLLAEIDNLKATLSNLKDMHSINLHDINIKESQAKFADSLNEATLRKLTSEYQINEKQLFYMGSLLAMQLKESQSKIDLNNANTRSVNFVNAINDAKVSLKGIGGLADYEIQGIESALDSLHKRLNFEGRKVSVNERMADISEFNSIIDGILSVFSSVK